MLERPKEFEYKMENHNGEYTGVFTYKGENELYGSAKPELQGKKLRRFFRQVANEITDIAKGEIKASNSMGEEFAKANYPEGFVIRSRSERTGEIMREVGHRTYNDYVSASDDNRIHLLAMAGGGAIGFAHSAIAYGLGSFGNWFEPLMFSLGGMSLGSAAEGRLARKKVMKGHTLGATEIEIPKQTGKVLIPLNREYTYHDTLIKRGFTEEEAAKEIESLKEMARKQVS